MLGNFKLDDYNKIQTEVKDNRNANKEIKKTWEDILKKKSINEMKIKHLY